MHMYFCVVEYSVWWSSLFWTDGYNRTVLKYDFLYRRNMLKIDWLKGMLDLPINHFQQQNECTLKITLEIIVFFHYHESERSIGKDKNINTCLCIIPYRLWNFKINVLIKSLWTMVYFVADITFR